GGVRHDAGAGAVIFRGIEGTAQCADADVTGRALTTGNNDAAGQDRPDARVGDGRGGNHARNDANARSGEKPAWPSSSFRRVEKTRQGNRRNSGSGDRAPAGKKSPGQGADGYVREIGPCDAAAASLLPGDGEGGAIHVGQGQ